MAATRGCEANLVPHSSCGGRAVDEPAAAAAAGTTAVAEEQNRDGEEILQAQAGSQGIGKDW